MNKKGIKVQTITGKREQKYGFLADNFNPVPIIIPEMHFDHPMSKWLYMHSFKDAQVSPDQWLEAFWEHERVIESSLERIITQTPKTPDMFHNITSLREYNVASAIACRNIIRKNPQTNFISYAADSSFERMWRVNLMPDFVQELISTNDGDFGPYRDQNLFHIVVNKWQEMAFRDHFNIPHDRLFRLHDFHPFNSPEPEMLDTPQQGFLEYLSKNSANISNNQIQYNKASLNENTFIINCPHRPVARKRIRTAILLAYLTKSALEREVAVVVTHPNEDEGGSYLYECIDFANRHDIPFIYLGESLKLYKQDPQEWTYDQINKNLSAMDTITTIFSEDGAWENAANESIAFGNAVFMNRQCRAYPEFQEMRLDVFSQDLNPYYRAVDSGTDNDPEIQVRLDEFVNWIRENVLNKKNKRKYVTDLYRKAQQCLSDEAVTPTFDQILYSVAG